MPRYSNGYIPRSELVLIEGNHLATRGTAARWEALKADVLKHEGIRLRITGGENAYRSFAGQQFARKNACAKGRCNDAAVPGTSSHGGSLNGRDAGAIDVDNWAALGKEKFYAYCRRNGFEPGYFSWEPWHIIDWAPYTVPTGGGSQPSGGGSSKPAVPDTKGKKMKYILMVTRDNAGGIRRYLLDPEKEAHREISQTKYEVYKNSGAMALVAGDQPESYLGEWPAKF